MGSFFMAINYNPFTGQYETNTLSEAVPETTQSSPSVGEYGLTPEQYKERDFDFNTLSSNDFISKWGAESINELYAERELDRAILKNAILAESDNPFETAWNAGKNIVGAGVTGLIDLAALATSPISKDASTSIAKFSDLVSEGVQAIGTEGEEARRNLYALKQLKASKYNRSLLAKDIASGMSKTEAELSYIGREGMNALNNMFETGHIQELGASGIGSLFTGGLVTKGVKLGGIALKNVPSIAKLAKSAGENSPTLIKKIADNAPWMFSMGALEGGGAYTQQVNSVLSKSTEELTLHSSEFNKRVAEYLANNPKMTLQEAQEQAKEDLAVASAQKIAAKVAVTAGLANALTGGLTKPLQHFKKPSAKAIGESLTEPVEEAITEGTSQLISNVDNARRVDDQQEWFEGVGQSAAEGAGGGLGIVGTTAAVKTPAMAKKAAIAGANFIDKKLGSVGDFGKSAEEKSANYLKNVERATTELDSSLENTSYSSMRSNLDEDMKVFNSSKDEEGKVISTASTDDLINAYSNSVEREESIAKLSLPEDQSLATKANNTQKAFTAVNKNIQNQSADLLEQNAINALDTHKEGTPYSEEDIEKLGAYGSALIIKDPSLKTFNQFYNELPEPARTGIASHTFNNPVVASSIKKALPKTNPTLNTSVNTLPSSTALTDDTQETKSTLVKPAKTKVDLPSYSKEANKSTKVPAYKTGREIADNEELTLEGYFQVDQGPFSIFFKKGNPLLMKDNEYKKVYEINHVPSLDLQENPPEVLKEANPKIQEFLTELEEQEVSTNSSIQGNIQFTVQDSDGGSSLVEVAHDRITIDGVAKAIPDEVRNVFLNPDSTDAERTSAIASIFSDGSIVTIGDTQYRKAQELQAERAKREYLLKTFNPDGTVDEDVYDSQEVTQKFTDKLGETFTNMFAPVRRGLHLLMHDSPIQAFKELISNYDTFESYVRMNGQTNAMSLIKSAFHINGEISKKVQVSKFPDEGTNLVSKILSLLNPKGYFINAFDQASKETLTISEKDREFNPKATKLAEDLFYENGKLKKNFEELFKIASIHMTQVLSNFRHELVAEELSKIGINPEIQDESFTTSGGVPVILAMQHFKTNLRKFMGVNIANKADIEDYDKALGFMSMKLMKTLAKAEVIESFDIDYLASEYDQDVHKIRKNLKQLKMVKPVDDYQRLFGAYGDILARILDPTMKNAWHTSPGEADTTIAHTSIGITKQQKTTIESLNNKPTSIATRYAGLLASIGGVASLYNLFSEGPSARELSNIKDHQSRQGKLLNAKLAEDQLYEIILANLESPISTVKIYWDHFCAKNSRFFQKGSAPQQSNSISRQLFINKNMPTIDLTKSGVNYLWKEAVAQAFGLKTGKDPSASYMKDVEKAIAWLEDYYNKHKELHEIATEERVKNLVENNPKVDKEANYAAIANMLKAFKEQASKDAGKGFNCKVSLKLFGVIPELFGYFEAKKAGTLTAFDSQLMTEIDGINDGPSYIVNLLGLAMSGASPEYLENMYKTGHSLAVKTTTNNSNDYKSEESAIVNPDKGDLHNLVAKKYLAENIHARLQYWNKILSGELVPKDTEKGFAQEQAKRALEATKAMFKMFMAIGWIEDIGSEEDIDKAVYLKGNADAFNLHLYREVSKVLVTVIPYGSEVQGTTDQVVKSMVKEVYKGISKKVQESLTKGDKTRYYSDFLDALKGTVCYIDFETTSGAEGPNPDLDQIVQVSVRKVHNGQEIGESHFLIKNRSKREIQEFFGKGEYKTKNPIHSLYSSASEADLVDPKEGFEELFKYIGDAPLIGHNIDEFDKKILEKNAGREVSNRTFDTLKLSRELYSSRSNHRLESWKNQYEKEWQLDSNVSHDATFDTLTTVKLAQFIAKELPAKVKEIQKAEGSKEQISDPFNGVSFGSLMESISTLMSLNYDKEEGVFKKNTEQESDKFTRNFTNVLPTLEEYNNHEWSSRGSNRYLVNSKKQTNDIRNFEITADGLENLGNLFIPIFGEAAQAAVNKAISPDGMRGSRIPAAIGSMLNLLAESLEQKLRLESGNRGTASDEFRRKKQVEQIQPIFTLTTGARFVAEKSKFVLDQAPDVQDPDGVFNVVSSETRLDNIGVSPGPLSIHAGGDASTVINAIKELGSLINFLNVFDGLYGTVDALPELSRAANYGSLMARKQLFINSIVHRMNQVGKTLHSLGLTKETDPKKAIKECILNLAKGQMIDGSNVPDSAYSIDDVQRSVVNLISKLEQSYDFEPNLQKTIQQKKQARGGNKFAKTGSLRKIAKVETSIDKFFTTLDAICRNEKVYHEVVDKIPSVTHHMSGVEQEPSGKELDTSIAYVDGTPLETKVIKEIIKEFSSKYGFDPKDPKVWFKVLSAYINGKASIQWEKTYPSFGKDTPEYQEWARLTGRDQGNSGFKEMTPEDVALIDNYFSEAKKNTPNRVTSHQNNILSSKVNAVKRLPPASVNRAFDKVMKSFGDSATAQLFKRLLKIVKKNIPSNCEIFLINSLNSPNLDPKVKKLLEEHRENNQQRGFFIKGGTNVLDGRSVIVIFDNGGSQSMEDMENAITLVHESIHASMSNLVYMFTHKYSGLSKAQIEAFQNIEKLLDDINDLSWAGGLVPRVVENFLEVLPYSDKKTGQLSQEQRAERLDEALAYIMSHGALFKALEESDFTDSLKSQHTNRFYKLLDSLKKWVVSAFKSVFHIVSGSALDKAIDPDSTRYEDSLERYNFLSLFGANNVTIWNSEKIINDPDPKNSNESLEKIRSNRELVSKINKDISWVRPSQLLTVSARPVGKNPKMATAYNLIKSIFLKAAAQTGNLSTQKDLRKTLPKVFERLNSSKALKNIADYRSFYIDALKDVVDDPSSTATTICLLQHEDALSSRSRYNLTQIYNFLVKNIKEDSFISSSNPTKEELEKSKEIYNFLINLDKAETPKISEIPGYVPQFQQQALFFALVLHSPEIGRKLNEIKIPSKIKDASFTKNSLLDYIENVALNSRADALSKAFNDKELDDLLKDITAEVASTGTQDYTLSLQAATAFENKIDSVILSSLLLPAKAVSGNLHKKIQSDKSDQLYKRNIIAEEVRKAVNTFIPEYFVDWFKDFYGRTLSNSEFQTLLSKIKGRLDRIRKAKLDKIPELLLETFKDYKVTLEDRKFLDRILGQADICVLKNEIAQDVLTDPAKLDAEIQKREERLRKESSYPDEQIKKSKQLANFLMGSRESGHNLLTNATAIAELVGTNDFHKSTPSTIRLIDELTTLYGLKYLNEGDIKRISWFYSQHSEGINAVIDQLRTARDVELERSKEKNYKYNSIKGWRPSGNRPTGHYIIIPKAKFESFKKQGYQLLGTYEKSNIDTSEPMLRVWNPYPHQKELQEGIIQTITQTAFGYHVLEGTRAEAYGTRILNTEVAEKIFKNINKETSKNGVIPLFDSEGSIIGYERSIPPEDRKKLEECRDLFTGIAQYRVRQEREGLAGEINAEAIDYAYEHWDKATDRERKTQFIDVMHSSNPAIKQAVARFDSKTRERISQKFNGNHLYLRKDEVANFVGYYRASLTDMWSGDFILPEKVEKALSVMLDAIIPSGKARFYLGQLENFIIGSSSYIRNTIVIRSLFVPIINAVSNVMLLVTAGVPIKILPSLIRESIKDTEEYNYRLDKQIELKFKLENLNQQIKDFKKNPLNLDKYHALLSRRNSLESEQEENDRLMKNLPIYSLIGQGLYATISNEGMLNEEIDIYRDKAEALVTKGISKVTKNVDKFKKIGSEVLMTRNSQAFGLMTKVTNYGDWIAKVAIYRCMTEDLWKRGVKYDKEMARNTTDNLFVNYDQFVGRDRDWFNRIGLTWFMTFKWRMLASLSIAMSLHPGRLLTSSLLGSTTGFFGTPLTDNIFSKLFTGTLSNSVGILDTWFRGITLHPLLQFFNLFA